jgi:3-oxoacyl-(acyl-carrier-protein) synthase
MTELANRLLNQPAKKLALLGQRLRATPYQCFVSEPIAVIGIACRFPGAATCEQFWQLLVQGGDAITEIPPARWDVTTYYHPDPHAPGKSYSRWGGFLDGVDLFDAAFFGISPREAQHMDPRQRILLETAWTAFENAGLAPEQLSGSNTGVFSGHMVGDYYALEAARLDGIDAHASTGNLDSVLANRLSYVLSFQGPTLAVDTACSSSLVALYLACQSLRQDECQLAIAGGINLMLTPEMHVMGAKSRILSPAGRCKTFDRSADGFVRSEGCGLLVLKRLADALVDHDRVHAVIRGIAVNQDGRTNGISAPNGLAQQRVIRRALDNAQLEASRVTFLETHGTGTVVGDTIEFEALAHIYGQPSQQGACHLGAVKTNVGHLEGAAGAAGVIKMVLCLRHGLIPPNLHFREINPHLALDSNRFRFPLKVQPWAVSDGPRRGAVSSFGLGGTNGHVVLEEAPDALEEANVRERPSRGLRFAHQRYWLPSARLPSEQRESCHRPLIDSLLQSPLVKETILTASVSVSRLPYLADPRVFGEIVVPGSVFLSMMLNGADLLGWHSCQIENVDFLAPLWLPRHEERMVQVVVSPADDSTINLPARFQTISLPGKGSPEAMITHVTGGIRPEVERALPLLPLMDIPARFGETADQGGRGPLGGRGVRSLFPMDRPGLVGAQRVSGSAAPADGNRRGRGILVPSGVAGCLLPGRWRRSKWRDGARSDGARPDQVLEGASGRRRERLVVPRQGSVTAHLGYSDVGRQGPGDPGDRWFRAASRVPRHLPLPTDRRLAVCSRVAAPTAPRRRTRFQRCGKLAGHRRRERTRRETGNRAAWRRPALCVCAPSWWP